MGFELSREQIQRFTGRGDIAQLARALAQGDDVEDLVQDTCLTAMAQSSAPERFDGWSRQVLRNRFRDRLRRRRRRRVREAKYQASAVPPASAEDRVLQVQLRAALAEALATLPPAMKRVLIRRFVDEDSPAKIAAEENCSPATIRWRTHTAIRRMRAQLDQQFAGREHWRTALLVLVGLAPGSVAQAAVHAETHRGTGTSMSYKFISVLVGLSTSAFAVGVFVFSSTESAQVRIPPASSGQGSVAAQTALRSPRRAAQARGNRPQLSAGITVAADHKRTQHESDAVVERLSETHCSQVLTEFAAGHGLGLQFKWRRSLAGEAVLAGPVTLKRRCDPGLPARKLRACRTHQEGGDAILQECAAAYLLPEPPEVEALPESGEPQDFEISVPHVVYCGPSCPAPGYEQSRMLPSAEPEFVGLSTAEVWQRGGRPRLGAEAPRVFAVKCGSFGGFETQAHADLKRLLQAHPQLGVVWLAATPYNSTESAYLARAGFAAERQGQFWSWHAAVNGRKPRRERAALLRLAGELGFDVARFEADLDSEDTLRGVANHRAWCRAHKCYGSPCVFFGELSVMGHWGYERLERTLLDQL